MQILQRPRVGDLVLVRDRRWVVTDLRGYDQCQVVTLCLKSGAGEQNTGVIRRVIAPFDVLRSVERPARLRVVRPRLWSRACRAVIADSTSAGALRAGRRADIAYLPHQLEPALAIVRGFGPRLLLADDVGLGKTIQAGLVLSELRARGAADRALILTPASLRDQWAEEFVTRFAIEASVVDAKEIRRRVSELPLGVNPWSTMPVVVASIDYVKRPETLPAAEACRWDVLIVDEAHACAGEGDRHRALQELAARSTYVMLLTATPHSGDAGAFRSLCSIGGGADPIVVFRRTRRDVRPESCRRVHRLWIRPSEAERRMYSLLARFGRAAREAHDREHADRLALAVLNKRALSSARSLLYTVERCLMRHGESVAADNAEQSYQAALPLSDADGETDDGDQAPELDDFGFEDPRREADLLRELADAARAASIGETKLRALGRLLRRIREPVLVFTEYRDTLLHLQRNLEADGGLSRLTILHGGLSREARAKAIGDFRSGRRPILLATDTAGEGLNLQHGCRVVVNLELPWNPMRLEQRIGRVDRLGQRRTVHAFHLIARDTPEMQILERLRKRVARAQSEIGAGDPVGPLCSPLREFHSDCSDDEVGAVQVMVDADEGAVETEPENFVLHRASEALASDAVAEAARLTFARRLCKETDESAANWLEADGAWLAFARCPATRGALGSRVLAILVISLEDSSGRRAESTLVPVAIDLRSLAQPLDRLLVAELLKQAGSLVAGDAVLSSWRAAASAIFEQFMETRLRRERAIADLLSRADGLFQPGLFDRRAERRHDAALSAMAEARSDAARRIAAIELVRSSLLSLRPVHGRLVIAPRLLNVGAKQL